MEIRLQISDGAYQRMMAHGGRVQGTIGLVNPQEGNFNEHMRRAATASTEYIRLAHGRASVDEKKARLTLTIDLDEANILPAKVMKEEAGRAANFVEDFRECFGWEGG